MGSDAQENSLRAAWNAQQGSPRLPIGGIMLFQSVWKLVCATIALSTGFLSLLKLGRTFGRLDSGKCNIIPDMLYARQSNPQTPVEVFIIKNV